MKLNPIATKVVAGFAVFTFSFSNSISYSGPIASNPQKTALRPEIFHVGTSPVVQSKFASELRDFAAQFAQPTGARAELRAGFKSNKFLKVDDLEMTDTISTKDDITIKPSAEGYELQARLLVQAFSVLPYDAAKVLLWDEKTDEYVEINRNNVAGIVKLLQENEGRKVKIVTGFYKEVVILLCF